MLEFQLNQVPFSFGIQEGNDPKQVPFGTLLVCRDLVWEKSGRLEKRQGCTPLGSVPDGQRLIVRGRELAVTDGVNLYSRADGGWVSRGRIPNIGLTWTAAQDPVAGMGAADVGILSNGTTILAWVTGDPTALSSTSSEVWYSVVDVNGVTLVAPTILSSGAGAVRVVTSATSYAIVWSNVSAGVGQIRAFANGSQVSLRTDALIARAAAFDAYTIGTNFVIAYQLNAGGIRLASFNFSLAQQATNVVTGETSTGVVAISIAGAPGETLFIGYADGTAETFRRAMANPTTLAQTVAPATFSGAWSNLYDPSIGVERIAANTANYTISFSDNGTTDPIGTLYSFHMTSAGVASTTPVAGSFIRLLSRPFTLNSRQYAFVATSNLAYDFGAGAFSFDNTAYPVGAESYLVDITATAGVNSTYARLVGKVDLLTAGAWYPGALSNAPLKVGGLSVLSVTPFQSSAASFGRGWRQGARFVTASSGSDLPSDMWRSVQIQDEAVIAAGVVTAYDGATAEGYGVPHAPWLDFNRFVNSTTGGNISDGTYLYQATVERRGATGMLHRGPVSQAFSVTTAGGNFSSVTVAVVPVNLAPTTALVALYRTIEAGDVLHRLTVEPAYFQLLNVFRTRALTIADLSDDGSIEDLSGQSGFQLGARPALYTEGGELEDTQPPALLTLTTYRNRLFGIDGSRRAVRYTKSLTSNPGVAPGFNSALRIIVDDELTALAVLDERVFIFSSTSIYYLSGDGPAVNGDRGFGEPNELQTDVGCTNPRGIVAGLDGVFFVSGNEIYMLDRKLKVQWVGKPVQDLLTAFPNVTSAVLVASKSHVRFTANAADGGSGIVLVFDYIAGQWSHFEYNRSSETGGSPIVDACMHDGVYTFLVSGGAVFKESDSTWLDNGAFVVPVLETAWIHAGGPLAYHSVRNFRIDGVSASAHGLSISVGFNGESSYQQGPTSWAEGVSGVTAVGDSVTANISIGPRRKCRSIRFKVTETAPAVLGTGQGAKWSTMGIESGTKRGPGALPAPQKG